MKVKNIRMKPRWETAHGMIFSNHMWMWWTIVTFIIAAKPMMIDNKRNYYSYCLCSLLCLSLLCGDIGRHKFHGPKPVDLQMMPLHCYPYQAPIESNQSILRFV